MENTACLCNMFVILGELNNMKAKDKELKTYCKIVWGKKL